MAVSSVFATLLTAAAIPELAESAVLNANICGLPPHQPTGIQVTAIEQIEVLGKVGCEDAIEEIKRHNRPLSTERLTHYIELNIDTGLVGRITALAKIGDIKLSTSQLDRLVVRCLMLEWDVDALFAARHGTISGPVRRKLIDTLIAHRHVDDEAGVLELLSEKL